MMKLAGYCVIAAWAMISMVGCGSELGDVRGQVTMAGQPMTDAVIHFVPERGPQAEARLDDDGNYRLITPGKGTGAVPGKHRVYLVPEISEKAEAAKENLSEQDYIAGKLPEVSQQAPQSSLPAKFLSPNTSDLVREVTTGSNEFDFDVSSH